MYHFPIVFRRYSVFVNLLLILFNLLLNISIRGLPLYHFSHSHYLPKNLHILITSLALLLQKLQLVHLYWLLINLSKLLPHLFKQLSTILKFYILCPNFSIKFFLYFSLYIKLITFFLFLLEICNLATSIFSSSSLFKIKKKTRNSSQIYLGNLLFLADIYLKRLLHDHSLEENL